MAENLRPRRAVEFAGRFIRQDEFGPFQHGPNNGDTLLFAAGEFIRPVVQAVRQTHLFEKFDGPPPQLTGNSGRQIGNERILDRGQITQQVKVLKNEPDVITPVFVALGRAEPRKGSPVNDNVAARRFVKRTD